MISSRKILAFVLFAVLGLHSVSVRSQNMSETDSLLSVLKTLTAAEDSARFEILKKLAFNHTDPIKSLAYAQEALLLARDLKDSVRVARALEELPLVHAREARGSGQGLRPLVVPRRRRHAGQRQGRELVRAARFLVRRGRRRRRGQRLPVLTC